MYALLKWSQIRKGVDFGIGCASKKVTIALMQTTIGIFTESNPDCVCQPLGGCSGPALGWLLLLLVYCKASLLYCLPGHSKHSKHSARAFFHIASIGTPSAPLPTNPSYQHSIYSTTPDSKLLPTAFWKFWDFSTIFFQFLCVCLPQLNWTHL